MPKNLLSICVNFALATQLTECPLVQTVCLFAADCGWERRCARQAHKRVDNLQFSTLL